MQIKFVFLYFYCTPPFAAYWKILIQGVYQRKEKKWEFPDFRGVPSVPCRARKKGSIFQTGWDGRDFETFFLLWWLPWRAERLTAQTLIISSCAFKWPNCLSCLSLSNWDFILNRNFQIFAQVFSLFWQIRCQVQTRSCGMFKDCVFFQSFFLWWGWGVSLRPNTF